ncbi:Gfo/Idh/MocA family oxidoreductase [Candidatus Pseudothioglobus singularis]|nr:Gfo/Idh/MocA family oxidoreductase [Candidatus Pseudothioglobus singularis]
MIDYPLILGRKVRIAIVGCGRISKNHFNSIFTHKDDLELVAICDNDSDALLKHEIEFKVNGYSDLNKMLESEKIDLVSICTPSGLHALHTEICAKFFVNVLTEKPIATKWKDGLRMFQACDLAGVRLFVVKQNRKNATLQLLKRAINDNRFGQINMIHINVFWTRPQSYYDQASWRGTFDLDGGAYMNQASHYVDLLHWLGGPISEVHAMMSTSLDIEAEDTGILNLRWKNGALGSMCVTMLTYPKNLEGSLTILGEKGSVRIGGVAVNEIKHWEFEDDKDYDKHVVNSSYETTSVYGLGHPLYYKNVIEVLRGNAEPEADGKEGLKTLEIIIAAYKSNIEKKVVSIPLSREDGL